MWRPEPRAAPRARSGLGLGPDGRLCEATCPTGPLLGPCGPGLRSALNRGAGSGPGPERDVATAESGRRAVWERSGCGLHAKTTLGLERTGGALCGGDPCPGQGVDQGGQRGGPGPAWQGAPCTCSASGQLSADARDSCGQQGHRGPAVVRLAQWLRGALPPPRASRDGGCHGRWRGPRASG